MLRIKRLYLYILQTFVPVFFMTFAICLFIILMQFLWKYVEDLVGKGLDTHVLAELFLYAALTLVPMALPLAILLASLMSFGNLGERYELLAIKAAGISLLRAMRPLIILMVLVCIGAFFFQNDIIPKINVKFRTLMISVKQKSPELDIPEGSFYSGIDNYNIYVKTKDKETGTLRDVMIYDVSKGFDNMAVIVCDSAKMKMSSNKDYLQLNLYNGQQFANFKQSGLGDRATVRNDKFVPYSRENFKEKEVIIPFDANFNRMDEASMDGTQIAKNVSQLRASVDSLTTIVDSLNINDRKVMLKYTYLSYRNNYQTDTTHVQEEKLDYSYSLDSVLNSLSPSERVSVYSEAMSRAEANKNDFMFRSISKIDTQKKIRQHNVELQRKFTLSFACLIFFFIGAPLGAIIRKGGLGMPVVVSVILFIIYYIIDNLGYKMARDGVWAVWQGVWLSSFILFPLGVFITYKAINDSALFNADAYRNYYVKLFGDRSLMTLNELFSTYDKRAKDALKVFAAFLLTSIAVTLTKGFISSTFSILQWISGILYLFLLIDIFFTRQEFYSRIKEKIEISGIILNFTIGIPFYFILYFLHKNKMKKILLSYKEQTIITNI
ncbi:YjgP/YjgQ family permease [Dysgonomonas sp. HDW5B]|uniref:LptF/LptG family permease n=1 Tax=Dysgonomonas sp. HDW5B TaxID=2714927 RepID=UPI00140D9E74|nr:LptF/LptG family permease [Dysgonomonas sp. HDW5B]QIK55925.1 YjgP/YjgQ family permease [Dysgonomonas sp. HDW5B]